MKSKLSGLTILCLLFISVITTEKKGFAQDVDTTDWFSIQNYFLSPFQLTEYNFLGGGARARGMGGAFFAVSDDPTAASWNPAGLSQMDKSQMNLSFSSYMHRTKYTSTLQASPPNYIFGDKLKYDDNSISFVSVVIPFKIREKEIVGGILYQKLADIYQESNYGMVLDSAVLHTAGDYTLPPMHEKVTGGLGAFNISLGAKLLESLSLGAGVNIYTGKFTTDVSFFIPVIDTSWRNGVRFYPHIESKYSGFNFIVGVMYKIDKLRLGGVVKTPFTLREDNAGEFFADTISTGIRLERESELMSVIFDREDAPDRKWKMPAMVGFGTSYQLNALTLAADLEFRNYSKTEVSYRKNIADPSSEELITGDSPLAPSLGWRNLTQFRLGGEYMINTKYGKIPLRIGFRNDPKLFTTQLDSSKVYLRVEFLPNDTVNYKHKTIQSSPGIEKGSWVNGNVFTFGTGIAWSQIKLDITYEYAKYDDVSKEIITGRTPYEPQKHILLPPLEQNRFLQAESNKDSRIIISFTGYF